MSSDPKKSDKKPGKGQTPEEILNGFQVLRGEQRQFTSKLSELEQDLSEHKMVIETLKNVNNDRKCYRMVGGVLTERTVKDVLPVLESNQIKLAEVIEKLNETIMKKGVEINEYREKYNIRFQGLDSVKQEIKEEPKNASESRGNVLVS